MTLKRRHGSGSDLRGALMRAGGQLRDVDDVEGEFEPTVDVTHKGRVYGVLRTFDAEVKVGFDAAKVRLPTGACRMIVSGKLWLNERGGDLTIMVSRFRVLARASGAAGTED
jgi:hypothetical protein